MFQWRRQRVGFPNAGYMSRIVELICERTYWCLAVLVCPQAHTLRVTSPSLNMPMLRFKLSLVYPSVLFVNLSPAGFKTFLQKSKYPCCMRQSVCTSGSIGGWQYPESFCLFPCFQFCNILNHFVVYYFWRFVIFPL